VSRISPGVEPESRLGSSPHTCKHMHGLVRPDHRAVHHLKRRITSRCNVVRILFQPSTMTCDPLAGSAIRGRKTCGSTYMARGNKRVTEVQIVLSFTLLLARPTFGATLPVINHSPHVLRYCESVYQGEPIGDCEWQILSLSSL
jgi:hypothetical protein